MNVEVACNDLVSRQPVIKACGVLTHYHCNVMCGSETVLKAPLLFLWISLSTKHENNL